MDMRLSTHQHGMMASWLHVYVACRGTQDEEEEEAYEEEEEVVFAPQTCFVAAQTRLERSKMRRGSWGIGVLLQRLLLLQYSTATLVTETSSSIAIVGSES